MANARSIINQAARKIHVLGRGQTLSAEEAQDALIALNNLLSTFSAQAAIIFNTDRESFPLTGAQSYSIGLGGDFNTARPVDITDAFITSGSTDYPLTQIDRSHYAGIAVKSASGIADSFYYENNSPLGRIFLNLATQSATLNLWSRKAITQFADLTTDYDMSDGVESALVHNLAVDIAPEYEKEASATVKSKAKETKTAVSSAMRRQNYPTSDIDLSSDCCDGDILSGYYN
jgi:hypothetical protein